MSLALIGAMLAFINDPKATSWESKYILLKIFNQYRIYSRKYGHSCDFSEKRKKRAKKSKIFENFGKNVQNLNVL